MSNSLLPLLFILAVKPIASLINLTQYSNSLDPYSVQIRIWDSNYIGFIQVKDNGANSTNIYDINILINGTLHNLKTNVFDFVDFHFYQNQATLEVNMVYVTKTYIDHYDQNLVFLRQDAWTAGYQIIEIQYVPNSNLFYVIDKDTFFLTLQLQQYAPATGSKSFIFIILSTSDAIVNNEDAVYVYYESYSGNAMIQSYSSTTGALNYTLPVSFTSSQSIYPLFTNQQLAYRVQNELYVSKQRDLFYITNIQKIEIWNSTSLTKLSEEIMPGQILSINECLQKIIIIVNQTNGNQMLYVLDSLTGINLQIIESQQLPNNYKYVLKCHQSRILIQTIFGTVIYQAVIYTPDPPINQQTTQQQQNQLNQLKQTQTDPIVQIFATSLDFIEQPLNVSAQIIPLTLNSMHRKYFSSLNYLIDIFFQYKFHRKNYTKIVWYMSQQMDLLAELRMKPAFMDQLQIQNSYQLQNQDQNYKEQITYNENSPQNIYYLQSIKEFVVFSIPVYFALQVMFFILRFIADRILRLTGYNRILFTVYKHLLIISRWWCPLACLIENNLSFVTFYGFLQIKEAYSFTFIDKAHYMGTIFLNFLYLIFSLTFYPMIYIHEQKVISRQIPGETKFHFKGFILMSGFGCLNIYMRSAIHSIFLDEGLPGLMAQSLVILCLCIYLKPLFINKTMFVITLTILLLTFIFDLHLYLFLNSGEMLNYQLWSFILIIGIIVMSVFKNIFMIVIDLKQFINKFIESIKKNRAERKKSVKSCHEERIQIQQIPAQLNNDRSLYLMQDKKLQVVHNHMIKKKQTKVKKQKRPNQRKRNNADTEIHQIKGYYI